MKIYISADSENTSYTGKIVTDSLGTLTSVWTSAYGTTFHRTVGEIKGELELYHGTGMNSFAKALSDLTSNPPKC